MAEPRTVAHPSGRSRSPYRSKPNSSATSAPDAGCGGDVGAGPSAVGVGAGLGVTGSDGGAGAGDGR